MSPAFRAKLTVANGGTIDVACETAEIILGEAVFAVIPANVPYLRAQGEPAQAVLDSLAAPSPNVVADETVELIVELRSWLKDYGWALGVHGTLARDIDLIAVPWTADAPAFLELWGRLSERFGLELGNHEVKPNNRVGYILLRKGWKKCGLDANGKEVIKPAPLDVSVVDARTVFVKRDEVATAAPASTTDTLVRNHETAKLTKTAITPRSITGRTFKAYSAGTRIADPQPGHPDECGNPFNPAMHEPIIRNNGLWRLRRGGWQKKGPRPARVLTRLPKATDPPKPALLPLDPPKPAPDPAAPIAPELVSDPEELHQGVDAEDSIPTTVHRPGFTPAVLTDLQRNPPFRAAPAKTVDVPLYVPRRHDIVRVVKKPAAPIVLTPVDEDPPFVPTPIQDRLTRFIEPPPPPTQPAEPMIAPDRAPDPTVVGTDSFAATHKLWGPKDPGCPLIVIDGGLEVCRKCGASEADLDLKRCPKAG